MPLRGASGGGRGELDDRPSLRWTKRSAALGVMEVGVTFGPPERPRTWIVPRALATAYRGPGGR